VPDIPQPDASTDELAVYLSEVRPDPILGAFVSPSPEDSARDGTTSETARPSADESAGVLGLGDSTPAGPTTASEVSPSSSEVIRAIQLSTSSSADSVTAKRGPGPQLAGRAKWLTVILASYASAVTLGLLWVLLTGRKIRDGSDAPAPRVADAPADPGSRALPTRRVVRPGPIEEANLATLGQTLTLSQLEATPVAVYAGPVMLERHAPEPGNRPGGQNALKLVLRLRNVSTDSVLSPFDEAFLRGRPGGEADCFIETQQDGVVIAMFPLPVDSEWSIAGQKFADLKPGEELETIAVSVPDAAFKTRGEMTWRLKLRTDLNHTDELAVRFHSDQVQPEP
jgi:hypothetical protein